MSISTSVSICFKMYQSTISPTCTIWSNLYSFTRWYTIYWNIKLSSTWNSGLNINSILKILRLTILWKWILFIWYCLLILNHIKICDKYVTFFWSSSLVVSEINRSHVCERSDSTQTLICIWIKDRCLVNDWMWRSVTKVSQKRSRRRS